MSWRDEPPFRADHVGSLLRPRELLAARDAHAAGASATPSCARSRTRRSARRCGMQEDVGLQSATDGEFRRASWHMDFIYQLGGDREGRWTATLKVEFRNAEGTIAFAPPSLHVDAPVRLEHTIFGDDFAFLRDTVTTAVPKLTIPSPSMVHYRGGRAAIDATVYPELDAFWADLTAAYRERSARLGELGCRYLQLDDTSLAYLNDPASAQHVGRHRRRPRAPARGLHPPHQRGARRPARPACA